LLSDIGELFVELIDGRLLALDCHGLRIGLVALLEQRLVQCADGLFFANDLLLGIDDLPEEGHLLALGLDQLLVEL